MIPKPNVCTKFIDPKKRCIVRIYAYRKVSRAEMLFLLNQWLRNQRPGYRLEGRVVTIHSGIGSIDL